MKILMVLDREFPPDMRVENEIEALADKGYDVHIACFTRQNKPSIEKTEFCTIHRKKISKLTYKSSVACLRFPLYFMFWQKFISQIYIEEKFDVMHIHDLPLAKIGWHFQQQYGLKFVLDLHENWPAYLRISTHAQSFLGKILSNHNQWVNYEKKYTTLADKVVVVVDEAKERLKRLPLKPGKIVVVSNTINLNEVSNLPNKRSKDFITLFYGGGINYHRGLQTIVTAMEKMVIHNSKLQLWIAGDGSYKRELEQLAKKLNLIPFVKFFGFKPYKEMLDILSQSDIALIPHLVSDHTNSTIPHKLFQYMFYEKPILSSNCLPIERILSETNTGITYNPDNAEELSNIIQDIVENFDKYKRMGKNGRLWVKKKYNWDFDKNYLLELYNSVHS